MVFTGSYKGNPACSVVLLYDAAGNVVGGTDESLVPTGDLLLPAVLACVVLACAASLALLLVKRLLPR